MKPIRKGLAASLLSAGALVTAAAGLSMSTAAISMAGAADDATTTTPPPPGPHGWHGHHHGPWAMLSQLGLSDPQMESLHQQMHANSLKLRQTAPTDANYSSITAQVSQTHGSLSAQLMAEQADVRAQIFKVLTPAQQAQLTALEAQMEARHAAHGPARGGPPPEGE